MQEVLGEAGFRSLTIQLSNLSGRHICGLLAESGVHRLIRTSPFDRKARRHTSFAVAAVLRAEDDAENEVHMPRSALKVETMRASGAGGQSVNMSETAVRITHLPTGISVKCQRAPSQIENSKTEKTVLLIFKMP